MPCRHLSVSEPMKAAVTHLLTSGARCAALLASSDAVFWTADPRLGFIEPQAAWQAYTGQAWEDARGMGWRHAVHEQDRPALGTAWETARATDAPLFARARVWHAGSHSWRCCTLRAQPVHDTQGEIVEWVGALADVQDQGMSNEEMRLLNDALQNELQLQHEDLTQLFSLSLDLMIALDDEGRVTMVNPTHEALTGLPASAMIGQPFSVYCHPDDIDAASRELARVLQDTQSIDFETRLRAIDGTYRTISWRAVGSRTASRVYATGRDVTERRQAEQRLVRAQRLEAVGQLTGGIAHDFNNILAAMLSYIEVASRATGQPQRISHALQGAAAVGRRGAALVSQLLTFARKQTLDLGPVDLNLLLRGMDELLRRTLGGKVDIRHALQPDLPPALTEPTQLELAVLNLCLNARDAMPEGGRIVLQTGQHRITEAAATQVEQLPQGEYVTLAVEDNGTGMDAATLARCVEPFFTTKSVGHGTGLGLSQVFGIVQQCGGAMLLRSRPGVGTRVTLYLPVASQAAAARREAPAETPPVARRGTSVLVVDDNPAMVDATRELLEVLGLRVTPAGSAAEALTLLRRGIEVDLLLTDYAMPDTSGAELVQRCRTERPGLPAVLVTGYDSLPGLHDALPGLEVLHKPFEPDALLGAIERAMSEAG